MKKLTTKEFINKSLLIHGNKYDYSAVNYINNRVNVKVICPVHGEFLQKAATHLNGAGCPHCGGTMKRTKDTFIKKSIEVHGDRYDYSYVEYKGVSTKVKILCKDHGEFWQTPKDHMKGCWCKKCANNKVSLINRENVLSWSLSDWIKSSKKSKKFDSFKVYVIECWNDEERFYKVGRTYHTIGRRFRGKHRMPYKWRLIKEVKGDAETVYDLENELKRKNKEFKYMPNIQFDGMYECFSKIEIDG